LAVDINIRNLTAAQLSVLIFEALTFFKYVKIYSKEKFIHCDLRKGPDKLEIT
jgi:hypothetical protein